MKDLSVILIRKTYLRFDFVGQAFICLNWFENKDLYLFVKIC
jgi:hypothetical protein